MEDSYLFSSYNQAADDLVKRGAGALAAMALQTSFWGPRGPGSLRKFALGMLSHPVSFTNCYTGWPLLVMKQGSF